MNLPDPRNADILVHVGGELRPRAEATVSVFDSVVQGGDAVWEGLRVYDGRIAELEEHLERLQNSEILCLDPMEPRSSPPVQRTSRPSSNARERWREFLSGSSKE